MKDAGQMRRQAFQSYRIIVVQDASASHLMKSDDREAVAVGVEWARDGMINRERP